MLASSLKIAHRTTRLPGNSISGTLSSDPWILSVPLLILLKLMQIIYWTSIHLIYLFTSILKRIYILFVYITEIIVFKIIITLYVLVYVLLVISTIVLLLIGLLHKVSSILSCHIHSHHLPVSHLFFYQFFKSY
jgi:hypothetical protein